MPSFHMAMSYVSGLRTRSLLLLLLLSALQLPACQGQQEQWSVQDFIPQDDDDCHILVPHNAQQVTKLTQGDDVDDDICTIIVFGAHWDGHFPHLLQQDVFQKLDRELATAGMINDQIRIAVYDFATSGDDFPYHLIPRRNFSGGGVLPSYDWYGYRNGKVLWTEDRVCTKHKGFGALVDNAVECFAKLCRGSDDETLLLSESKANRLMDL